VKRKSQPRTSAYKRALAARMIREGRSYAETARAAGVNKRTIARWMTEEWFLAMVHGQGVMSLGPVQVRAADSDVVHDLPAEESWLWIDTTAAPAPAVLGSLLVESATHLRVAFISTPERAEALRASLEQKRFPLLDGEPTTVLVPAALEALQEPAALELLVRLCTADPAEGFRAFLSLWHFRAQETKDVRVLGADLWSAQEQFIAEIAEHPHVYALKARKLGQSTIACAYDAFVLRFRDPNARVHLFSRREQAALELLTAVRFGLERLPAWLRLPTRTTAREIELDAGPHDRRLALCYPTTDNTAVEATATHTHIDEWADMPNPNRVYQALEPTFTARGCTSLLVTTGSGPANPSADYWRRCLAGEGLHHPVFIPATARPGRDQAWLEDKRRTMLPDAFATEYALSWEAAIAGTGARVFSAEEIDAAMSEAHPLVQAALRGRKYVIGWDIGSRHDFSVGIVLDVTEEPIQLASYTRIRGDYPQIQRAIQDLHRAFAASSFTVIEDNAIGAAVADNLTIPAHQLRRFTTSKTSKERIIEALRAQLQFQLIKFHPSLRQLESELRDYQLPDTNVVQDSVMSLAIALEHAAEARAFQARGRINRRLLRTLNAPAPTPVQLPGASLPWQSASTYPG
jgi:transposase-like protein